MSWHTIPLRTYPDQEFTVAPEVKGVNISLRLRLRYNTEGQFWHMDVMDGYSGNVLVSGVPLVTGEYPAADILRQHAYLGIGSALIVKATEVKDGRISDIPGLADLGSEYILVWGDAE